MQHGSPPQKSLAGTSTGSGLEQIYWIVNSTALCAVQALLAGWAAPWAFRPARPAEMVGTGCQPRQRPASSAMSGRDAPSGRGDATTLGGADARTTGSFSRTGWPGKYFTFVMLEGQIRSLPAAPSPSEGPGAGNLSPGQAAPAIFKPGCGRTAIFTQKWKMVARTQPFQV
ncbi:hypothetical protein NY78_1179 [Desulfovibrio sp. TomC]|nr:hypothetical protein NY78_1179 [Desulfovibrio sp. TomC]